MYILYSVVILMLLAVCVYCSFVVGYVIINAMALVHVVVYVRFLLFICSKHVHVCLFLILLF